MDPNEAAAFITMVLTIGVVTLAFITTRAKRKQGVSSPELNAINERLARMEQAINAMAVETERISEGQRFTTRLLSERVNEPLPRN